jgi:hypothetical protein
VWLLLSSKRWSCPCSCHEGIWQSKGIALLILNLCTRWQWVVIFTPLSLYPQEITWYPLSRKLGGPNNQSGYSGAKKNSLLLLGFKPQIVQSLYWLYCHDYPFWIFILIHHRRGKKGRGLVESRLLKVNTHSSLHEAR